MSVQLYSSQVRAANEWDVELKTQGEIPYLQATMCYINTIALFQQEKANFINEWKEMNQQTPNNNCTVH